jgi:hypothetical protein
MTDYLGKAPYTNYPPNNPSSTGNFQSLTPYEGSSAGGDVIRAYGRFNPSFDASPATFRFQGGAAIPGTKYDGGRYDLTFPAHVVGGFVVEMVQGGSVTGTCCFAYYYPDPTLASVTPANGAMGGGDDVTIKGTHLTGIGNVYLGGAPLVDAVVVDDYTITGQTGAATKSGLAELSAYNHLANYLPTRGQAWLPNAFTFIPPDVRAMDPSTGPTFGGTAVSVIGSGLHAINRVTVGGIDVNFTASKDALSFNTPSYSTPDDVPVIFYFGQTEQAQLTFGYYEIAAAVPGTPIPEGRGRWIVTLHSRSFRRQSWTQTLISDLSDARSRRLVRTWCQTAEFSFVIDGRSPQAQLIQELATDVVVRRWDEASGEDICVFRGIVDHTEDQLSEEAYSINVVCHDYLSLLQRRYLTATYAVTQDDQDDICVWLVNHYASEMTSSGAAGTSPPSGTPYDFRPGCYLPMSIQFTMPDGTENRPYSGVLRDRSYPANTQIGQALDDLAKVDGGFDYDLRPGQWWETEDKVRTFYNASGDGNPNQGVPRPDVVLMYGSTVATVTRTVDSGSYANYERVIGQQPDSNNPAQLFAEYWLPEADNITRVPVGLWQAIDNASDVSIQSTLDEKAKGDLNQLGILVPSYSLGLRPGFYRWGFPNMGDVCPLIILVGRLNVNTTIRVLGIEWDIGDDGQEDIKLTVGRPGLQLVDLLTKADRDVDALTRR